MPTSGAVPPALVIGSQKPLAFAITTGAEAVFEGDSLFVTNGLPAGQDVPTYFASYCNADATITNVAEASNGLANIISQYAAQVYPRRPAATGKPSATLFICIGSNDIAGLAAGTHPTYASVAAWYAALASYITTAVADGFIVFVNTITPRTDYNYVVDATRLAMNDLIRTNVTATGKVDMARRFQVALAADAFWQDGIHFTGVVGRKTWAQVIVDSILGNRAYGPVDDTLPQGSTGYPALRFQGPGGLVCTESGTIGFVGAAGICRAFVDGANGRITLTPFSGSHVWHINAGFSNPAADVDLALPVVSGTLSTLAGTEAFTNKTYNGNTITTGTGTLTLSTFTLTATASGNVVIQGGALGTPASGVATNLTGTASGLTAGTASAVAVGGITGLGTGVGTFLATPTSANLASAVTNETGSGALVFATNPSIAAPTFTGAPATPAAGVSIGVFGAPENVSFRGPSGNILTINTGLLSSNVSLVVPNTASGVLITASNLTDIVGTGTLSSGTAAAGFTIQLSNVTYTGTMSGSNISGGALGATAGTNLTGTAASLTAGNATLAAGLSATLAVASGGTNITSYAVGDLIYASGATTLSKLADVATGSVLVSGGVTTAPAWSNAPTFAGTNLTGTASGLTAGNVTTNANLTGDVTSIGNATTLVGGTSPAFTTSITTPSTTFALANTTATTVNAFGAASVALNIGNASGTNTITGTNWLKGITYFGTSQDSYITNTGALYSWNSSAFQLRCAWRTNAINTLGIGGVTSSFAGITGIGTAITFELADHTAGGSVICSGTLAVTGASTLGSGTSIKNIRHGISGSMVLGAVTITDTGATANTRYFFSAHALGTVSIAGGYYASSRSAGASFVCTSSQPTETSTIDWLAVEV